MEALNEQLNLYLVKKAPAIPANWQEILVKYLPWITLVMLILALPALLVVFGVGLVVLPFSYLGGAGTGFMYTLSLIVLAATLVMEGLAIPALLKKSVSGWNLLYYSALLNGVYNLLSFNLPGLIIGTTLSLYILFQIKHHYK